MQFLNLYRLANRFLVRGDFNTDELEAHIDNEPVGNRKNGSTSKTIKSTSGSFSLDTPRDRSGSFDPQLVKKHQTHMSDEIERKILYKRQASLKYGTSKCLR